jgi:hypothetical protein
VPASVVSQTTCTDHTQQVLQRCARGTGCWQKVRVVRFLFWSNYCATVMRDDRYHGRSLLMVGNVYVSLAVVDQWVACGTVEMNLLSSTLRPTRTDASCCCLLSCWDAEAEKDRCTVNELAGGLRWCHIFLTHHWFSFVRTTVCSFSSHFYFLQHLQHVTCYFYSLHVGRYPRRR